jgi:hypothetical protein
MTEKTYKITFIKHLKTASTPIISLLLGMVVWIYFYLNNSIDNNEVYKIALIIAAIIVFPCLYLHITYFQIDNLRELHYNSLNKNIQIKTKGGKQTDFSTNDILKIERCFCKFKVPYSSYFYYRICLKNDQKIIITSLLINDEYFLDQCSIDINCFYPLPSDKDIIQMDNMTNNK